MYLVVCELGAYTVVMYMYMYTFRSYFMHYMYYIYQCHSIKDLFLITFDFIVARQFQVFFMEDCCSSGVLDIYTVIGIGPFLRTIV